MILYIWINCVSIHAHPGVRAQKESFRMTSLPLGPMTKFVIPLD